MLQIFKKIFNKNDSPPKDPNALTQSTSRGAGSTVGEKVMEFKKGYSSEVKNFANNMEFQKFAVNLVVNKIKETEYGKHQEFVHEIRYFMHYLFLVLKDDYMHGDKIFLNTLTQVDNYIFSVYRKNPKLADNIRKLTVLANSNRFTENPKENILSYFVFLEENGIEIIDLLEDYCKVLENKTQGIGVVVDKKGKKSNKTYERKQSTTNSRENTGVSIRTLHSIAPSINESSYSAKLKIKIDKLDGK